MLEHNRTLATLDVQNNQIGDEGLVRLAQALQVNMSLQTLKLGGNAFAAVGCRALSLALEQCNWLQKLL
jgi:Ran GTPase-activating protein (RanGAP) involved in mRNA processing and transport